jgi:hypothetical protein
VQSVVVSDGSSAKDITSQMVILMFNVFFDLLLSVWY